MSEKTSKQSVCGNTVTVQESESGPVRWYWKTYDFADLRELFGAEGIIPALLDEVERLRRLPISAPPTEGSVHGSADETMAPQPLSETERDIRAYIVEAKKYGFHDGIPVAQVEVLLQELDHLRFPDSRAVVESSFTVYESSSEPELRHYRAMIDKLLSRRAETASDQP